MEPKRALKNWTESKKTYLNLRSKIGHAIKRHRTKDEFLEVQYNAKRRIEGVTANLKERQIPINDTILVGERRFSLGSPKIKGTRYLSTSGLLTCAAIMAYDAEQRLGFLAHAANHSEIADSFIKIDKYMPRTCDLIILGGGQSEQGIVNAIEHNILSRPNIKLIGINTAKSTTLGLWDWGFRDIALDTQSGEVFMPLFNPSSKEYPNDLTFQPKYLEPHEMLRLFLEGMRRS